MSTGTITNRLRDPSGTALSGVTVTARLVPNPSGFQTSTFYEISQLESTTTDANGDWALVLERNADITPGDTAWQIIEDIPPSAGPARTWLVQVASGTNTLYASLVSTPPGTNVPSYVTQTSGDARWMPFGALTIGSVQAVGTNTATGTATTAAASNHVHPLNPSVVGTGLSLVAGVISQAPSYLLTRVSTVTVTATASIGQLKYSATNDSTEKLETLTSAGTYRPPWNLPWGLIATQTTTAISQTTTSGTASNISGMTVTATLVANRYYEIEVFIPLAGKDANADIDVQVYDNTGAAVLQAGRVTDGAGATEMYVPVLVKTRPTTFAAGSRNFLGRFRVSGGAGTVLVEASAGVPYINIRDVGPAGAPS